MPHIIDSSLLILSGILFYAGFNHITWGVGQNSNRANLVFGLIALVLSMFSLSLIFMLKASDTAAYARALKWNLSILFSYYALLPWFSYALTGSGNRRWLAACTLYFTALALYNPFTPYSLQYSQLDNISTRLLPWGETYVTGAGRQGGMFGFTVICILLLHAYLLYSFISAFKRTGRRIFLSLAIAIGVLLLSIIQGLLVRLGYLDLPPLGIYAYLLMALLMSYSLNRDTSQRIFASEQRFKSLFEQSPLSIMLFSPQGEMLRVNRAFEALWGVEAPRLQGYNLLQDKQLADLGVLPYIKQGLTGQATEIPAINYNPAANAQFSGPPSSKMVRAFIYPVKDASGKTSEFTLMQEDISASVNLQQELAQREKDLRSILDNLPSLIGYWDNTLHNRFANRAYEGWYGLSPGRIRGMHVRELLGDDLFEKNLPYIERVLQGEAQMFERTFVLNEGKSVFHGLMHYVPDIEDGEVRGFYVLVSDVTTLKNMESRLAKSQAISHAGSWEYQIRNGNTWWSEETSRIFNVSADTPVTLQFIAERLHPEDRERVLDMLTQTTGPAGLPAFSIETRVVLQDGTLKWVALTVEASMDANRRPFLLNAVIQDISASKLATETQDQLQKQLMQAQKMESIGQLTGGIAHDFNNMLGAILGYTQLLRQVCERPAPDAEMRNRKYLDEILNAANRAKELIRQMMAFSRSNKEEPAAEVATTRLADVLNEVVSLLRSSIPSTISINLQIPDDTLLVRIKPVQLHQIMLNLVINARDAIGEYGNISVSLLKFTEGATCTSCKLPFAGTFARISVEDNGSGIPPELLNRIFDPFFTTKEVGKGTGMGLSVVHGNIHAIGGHITVISRPGSGTVINIYLPLNTGNAPHSPGEANRSSPLSLYNLEGSHIMVVDDEQSITTMLKELLEQNGARVSVFNQSSAALTAFLQAIGSYDLVITDETMPVISGFDMAQTMLQHRPDIPIILSTGYSEKVDSHSAKAGGISDFFYKPLDMLKLLKRVHELLQHNRLPVE